MNAQTVMEDVLKRVTILEGATTVCAALDTLWPQTDMDVTVSELLLLLVPEQTHYNCRCE